MGLARGYATTIGVVLVLVGLLGFIGNPIVGDPSKNPIFVTGTIHNLVHLITGALALYVAFGLRGDQQVVGVAGIGLLYLALFVLTLINPTLFDMLDHPINVADHVLHLGLAIASLGVAWYARSSQGLGRSPAR
jgi:uncharacterized membrane protein